MTRRHALARANAAYDITRWCTKRSPPAALRQRSASSSFRTTAGPLDHLLLGPKGLEDIHDDINRLVPRALTSSTSSTRRRMPVHQVGLVTA
jgi:hypothetical protein